MNRLLITINEFNILTYFGDIPIFFGVLNITYIFIYAMPCFLNFRIT